MPVLPWDMVDNSTRPCKRSSGWFSSHSTGSGRVPDPNGPHACHCFHLHQAIPCQITERLLMSLTLTCSSVAPAAKDSTRLRVLTTVGGFCQLPELPCVGGLVAPRVCPLVLAAARAPLGVIREDATSVIVASPPFQVSQQLWSLLGSGPGSTSQCRYSMSERQINPLNERRVQPS